jgi:thiol:disulfide interchange protein
MNEEDSIDFKNKTALRLTSQADLDQLSTVDTKSEEETSTEETMDQSSDNKPPVDQTAPEEASVKKENDDTADEGAAPIIKEEVKPEAIGSESDKERKEEKQDETLAFDSLKHVSLWDKLKLSLQPNLPKDLQIGEEMNEQQVLLQQQALSHFWAFLKGLLLTPTPETTATEKPTE